MRWALLPLVLLATVACGPSPSITDASPADDSGVIANPDSGAGADDGGLGADAVDSDATSADATEADATPTDGATTDAMPSDGMVLPPNTPGVVTNFANSVGFLFAPGGPQVGVVAGAIDPRRIAVVRGRVLDGSGAPIAGASISVHGAPQFGHSDSQADGSFDLALDGGARWLLDIGKSGFLPLQRAVDTPWTDFAVLPDVVLLPPDPRSTSITFGAAAPAQTAEGSMSVDADGARHASLIFPAGTTADMVMADGSTMALASGAFRATEYTVGPGGPAAMPGPLPPSSGYTYAVELSFDEALAAGASHVRFNQPVTLMVDNFLALPAGAGVPAGGYDRDRGQWVGEADGLVVDILGVAQGMATLDTNGDAAADDANTLMAAGISDADRRAIAGLYPSGGSVWLVHLSSFSPGDLNWALQFPDGAFAPPLTEAQVGLIRQRCGLLGSFISCDTQALGEHTSVEGTPFSLVYQSERVPARRIDDRIHVKLSDVRIPPNGLLGIELHAEIAGQRVDHVVSPAPNLVYDGVWDGKDAYGRTVYGPRALRGYVAFRFAAPLGATRGSFSFGEPPGPSAPIAGSRNGRVVELWSPVYQLLGTDGPDARELGLGGWTLNVHHVLDPLTGMVFLGSGGSLSTDSTVSNFGGIRGNNPPAPQEGQDIKTVIISAQNGHFEVGPDGTSYYLTPNIGTVYGVNLDGAVHMAIGCLASGTCASNLDDGRSVLDLPRAAGWSVRNFTIGFDGRKYFTLNHNGNASIWVAELDGRIRRLVGRTDLSGSGELVEGSVARDIGISPGTLLTVSGDGTVYFNVTSPLQQIWRVGSNGLLSRVAGTTFGAACLALDLRARDHCFNSVNLMRADRAGNLYVQAGTALAKIDPSGFIRPFAGQDGASCTLSLDQAPIETFCTTHMRQLRFDANDVPYLAVNGESVPAHFAVYRLASTVTRIFGGGDNGALNTAPLAFAPDPNGDFGLLPDGGLLLVDISAGFRQILQVKRPLLLDASGNYLVSSAEGRVVWVFDGAGRHLASRDALTGATLYTFGYDASGRLDSVTDSAGQRTKVERDAAGVPTAIVAPGGQRTELTVDASGWIRKIQNAAGEHIDLSYVDADGLLATFSDVRQRVSTFTWDVFGRLTRDQVTGGRDLRLAVAEMPSAREVTATEEGKDTVYRTFRSGDAQVRAILDPSLAVSTLVLYDNGRRDISGSDGTTSTAIDDIDPRFPIAYTKQLTITKGSRTFTMDTTRTIAGGTGYFGSGTMTQATTVNGQTFSMVLDGPNRTLTQSTPTGRSRVIRYDTLGRMVAAESGAGLSPLTLRFGPTGLLESYQSGERIESYEYDASRQMTAIVDPLRRTTLEHDGAGRVNATVDPIGRNELVWNADGSLASFRIGGGSAHTLSSDMHDAYTNYVPPGAPMPYRRSYDSRGILAQITLPSGRTEVLEHDAQDRLLALTTPEARTAVVWSTVADLPDRLTRTPMAGAPSTLAFTWDHGLPTQIATTGPTVGSAATTYGADFRPSAQVFTSGADTVNTTYAYDAEGRITSYGPLSFERGGPDGATSTVAIGTAEIAYAYASDGQLAGKSARVAGALRYAVSLTQGPGGLPATRAETVGGTTHAFAYTYDLRGALTEVKRDGTVTESYAYDARGNRTTMATYDAQDRLQTRGAIAYTIDDDGFLSRRGADRFTYSAIGELLAATVSGVNITYSYDGFRRLISRVDPNGTTLFYYADPFFPFRVSAYRAPGEALTALHYDELGHLVLLSRGATRWVVASDQVGSPRVILDETTGNAVKTVEWDTFGQRLSDSSPAFVLPIGYAGGIEDPSTGLVRFGLRDYEPASGRFTARDPIFLSGGQFNLYVYVGSSPVLRRDPLGLFCVGGSAYGGLGGGAKACFDKKGFSVCAELGVGAGSSVDLQPLGNTDGNFFGFTGGVKAGLGPLSVGCEGDYGVDLDKVGRSPCSIFKNGDCKGGAFGIEGSPFSGPSSGNFDPMDFAKALGLNKGEDGEGGHLFQLQGKAAVKGCQNASWSLF